MAVGGVAVALNPSRGAANKVSRKKKIHLRLSFINLPFLTETDFAWSLLASRSYVPKQAHEIFTDDLGDGAIRVASF
jgi:hypothetical protein